jgi:hypothetical protein
MKHVDDLDAWLDHQRLLDTVRECRGTPSQAAAALDRYRIVRNVVKDESATRDVAGVVLQ